MTMKKNALKLILCLLVIVVACQKEQTDEQIVSQKVFDAPSVENAKQFFNQNSNYAITEGFQGKTGTSTLRIEFNCLGNSVLDA
jgi:hypothetical protein